MLSDILEKAMFAEHDCEALIQTITRAKEKESSGLFSAYQSELTATVKRLVELEKLMQKYETERSEKSATLPELQAKLKSHSDNRADAEKWAEIIRQYTEITSLDESILFELVERIEVGEAKKIDGQRICDIKIFYRFVGNIDDAVASEAQDEAV